MAQQQKKKTEIVTGPKTDPQVDALLSAFYRTAPGARADYEPALRDAIAAAERDKRITDSIRLKQALLSLRSRYFVW